MEKIRVLHCLETIGSGGVEQRRLSLAQHLPEKYELTLVCTQAIGDLPAKIESEGVKIFEIGVLQSIFDVAKYRKLFKIIQEYRPHIIHGAVFEGVALAAVCGRLAKVPIIVLEETSDPQNRSRKADALIKFFSLFADKFVGVSQASVDYLTSRAYVSRNKATLIENGVAVPRRVSLNEKRSARFRLGIDDEDIVIGSVGRLFDDHKKFSDLISAFFRVCTQYSNAKLLLVGDGPDRKKLELQAQQLDLSGSVIFAGYQSDTALYYSIMDIFSLASQREAFGLVVAEAMMYSLPTVVSKVGGMALIVDENETGFHCGPGNISDIEEKLSLLIQDEDLRSEFGAKGYEKAITHYREDIYVEQVALLYQGLLDKRRL